MKLLQEISSKSWAIISNFVAFSEYLNFTDTTHVLASHSPDPINKIPKLRIRIFKKFLTNRSQSEQVLQALFAHLLLLFFRQNPD